MAAELSFFGKDDETKTKTNRKHKNALTVDRTTFYQDLVKFHESRGTPIVKLPRISGNGRFSEIDLYKLYELVTCKGGWMKVNSKNEWSEIEKEVGFPEKCVNSELALKHIYIRYFDKYERVNFMGEEKERIDEDEEENRHKRFTARALHSIPQSYNHGMHQVSESMRAVSKLSTELYRPSEYDKLTLSLLSPLPNEQDFAINVLTLMSNECKQTLRLWKCPKLIPVLLAHAGVFEQYNMREMFREFYSTLRGHSLERFWVDCLYEKPDLFDLMYEDGLTDEQVFYDPDEMACLYGLKDEVMKDLAEYPFLGIGRNYGTQDYIGQRVHQVASIIRNLSFFEENSRILANDRTLLRFVIMMSSVRWNDLYISALDVIGNIAQNIELKDPLHDLVSRQLFGLVVDNIESSDRALILDSLEILSKLCQNELNEEFILKNFKRNHYETVCTLILVQDMILLVYTLECLYSLTSLGERPCNTLVDIKGVVDTLVSLLTLEAQSLGPGSCIQMKVVETVPVHVKPTVVQQQMHRPQHAPQQMMVRTPDRVAYQSPQKMETPSRVDLLVKQNQQQMIQENEQFANAWLRSNFELSTSLMVKIEEGDLYRMYVNACQKVGRKGAITQHHFPRIVRSVFGGTVGPNPSENSEKPLNYYCGIKPRATQIQPEQTKTETIVIHPQKPADSALVAQLNMKSSQPATSLLQQVLTTNSQSATTTQSFATITTSAQVTPTTTSSLIKSLLANKVTTANTDTNIPATVVSMNQASVISANASNNMHQVAQRQQQIITQKQKQLNEQMTLPTVTPTKIVVSSPQPTPIQQQQQTITSMKIGSSTLSIKPANIETKSVVVTQNDPPPLAPLSIQSNKTPQQIKQTITLTPQQDGSKTVSIVASSQKITANKMLVDLLDKKAPEPPLLGMQTTVKRKSEGEADSAPAAKKPEIEQQEQVIPSPKTADLFAKLTQSILDSDEEDDEDEIEKAIPTKVIEKKVIEVKAGQQVIGGAQVQRQIIMGPNNQVILSPAANQHQTTATIKTDSGIQTVPIILQNSNQTIQGIQGQTIIQPPPQTQYILATNQQGQTYVVAQQQIQQPQQILLAQNPNQQTKTIIILQQNSQGQQQQQTIQVGQQPQQQKIIMTPSGQQVIYSTQRPVIPNQIGNTQLANRKIVFTNAMDGQTTPGGAKIMQAVQQPTQQSIIVQKGQKFQIGNTQISQVIQQQPQTSTVTSQPTTVTIQAQPAQVQQQQTIQIVQKAPTPVTVIHKSTDSPPSTAASTPKPFEASNSNSPQPEQQQQQQMMISSDQENSNQQISTPLPTPRDSPSQSQASSGTSSPAPTSSAAPAGAPKQVSIQIPVPQSQISGPNAQQYSIKIIPAMDPSKVKEEEVDANWPYVCDWRGCPRKKFASANEVYLHACAVHCPSLDGTPDLFCQWGGGNTLCDNLPRKRFSLMTHISDRHCTQDALKNAVQKRLAAIENGSAASAAKQPYPVTLIRQPNNPEGPNGIPNLINGPTNIQNAGAAAMQAIKRHSIDFNIAKEASTDENEGAVTKSIRLTAALILRNLVTYSNSAKRALRYHEYHLSQIALSSNESNRVIAQTLYEINEQISPFTRP